MKNWYCYLILLIILALEEVHGRTNQEPVNIGFIFSLPWDISNTLRAPIAGPLSIVLTAFLALICFAGLAFAPVWYIFGLPPRMYYQHNIPSSRSLDILEPILLLMQGNNTNYGNDGEQSRAIYPNFGESAFLFFPHEVIHPCRLIILCHAHGFLPILNSPWTTKILHFFSKKLVNMNGDYGEAIRIGLKDQGECEEKYGTCPYDIVTIAKLTVFYNIPKHIRDMWSIQIQP